MHFARKATMTMEELLKKFGNSTEGKKKVAKEMGISLATLYRHMNKKK